MLSHRVLSCTQQNKNSVKTLLRGRSEAIGRAACTACAMHHNPMLHISIMRICTNFSDSFLASGSCTHLTLSASLPSFSASKRCFVFNAFFLSVCIPIWFHSRNLCMLLLRAAYLLFFLAIFEAVFCVSCCIIYRKYFPKNNRKKKKQNEKWWTLRLIVSFLPLFLLATRYSSSDIITCELRVSCVFRVPLLTFL